MDLREDVALVRDGAGDDGARRILDRCDRDRVERDGQGPQGNVGPAGAARHRHAQRRRLTPDAAVLQAALSRRRLQTEAAILAGQDRSTGLSHPDDREPHRLPGQRLAHDALEHGGGTRRGRLLSRGALRDTGEGAYEECGGGTQASHDYPYTRPAHREFLGCRRAHPHPFPTPPRGIATLPYPASPPCPIARPLNPASNPPPPPPPHPPAH